MADVGDVLDVQDLDAVIEERSPDKVREEKRPEIADMRVAIDRRTARIHSNPPPVRGLDGFDGATERVPELEGHAESLPPQAPHAPRGSGEGHLYTPAMRRWVCIIALLAGFSADGYAWSARPRQPVPIERRLDVAPLRAVPFARSARPRHGGVGSDH